jgi:hypothetical protein
MIRTRRRVPSPVQDPQPPAAAFEQHVMPEIEVLLRVCPITDQKRR